jgi:hypothetical protein
MRANEVIVADLHGLHGLHVRGSPAHRDPRTLQSLIAKSRFALQSRRTHCTIILVYLNRFTLMEPCSQYFARCISALSGVELAPVFSDPEPLAAFVDDPACLVLRAFVSDDGTAVLSTSMAERSQGSACEVNLRRHRRPRGVGTFVRLRACLLSAPMILDPFPSRWRSSSCRPTA